jgi:hypothetical protein
MHGTELGYRYQSGIVCPDEDTPPLDDSYVYEPSTFPGCRLPHAWLSNGQALHDLLGSGYTLLKLGGTTTDTAPIERAIRDLGVPFDVCTIDEPQLRTLYGRDLLLIRPDLHVCWRGDFLPMDTKALARRVTGYLPN